jgi:histidine triad (HIT) family protein
MGLIQENAERRWQNAKCEKAMKRAGMVCVLLLPSAFYRRGVRMPDCLFCRIVAGAIPSQKVFEDEHVIAVRDINPQAPVHVLLLPKRHIASILDAKESDSGLLGRIALVAVTIARQEGLAERGFRLLTNTGPDGGQAVAHMHFHLLGGRKMGWPPG